MSDTIYVLPGYNSIGQPLVMRNPITRQVVPEDGALVGTSDHIVARTFRRRAADGDCFLGADAKEAGAKRDAYLKNNPRVASAVKAYAAAQREKAAAAAEAESEKADAPSEKPPKGRS